MGARQLITILVAAALAGALGVEPSASQPDRSARPYKIIVNPDNRLREVSTVFLREAFLKKSASWSGGETIRPVDLSRRFQIRERFTREVLNKTPAQLRAYWNQQIFSGKGVPPPELESEAAVIAYVLHHRGAVAYLPAEADPRGALVVTLR